MFCYLEYFAIVIEKYAKNARFCLICNLVSKIIPALQSRCTRFKFKHIPFPDAIKKVKLIASQEKYFKIKIKGGN